LKRTFQVTAVPVTDDKGELKAIAHFAKDITEQKLLAAQLLQAQKMEAVGKLAGGVAHDFNNILTAIIGYLEMALMTLGQENKEAADLREALAASHRAAGLVRQLLLFSRRQPMDFVALDLNREIDELLKMLRRIIGENVELVTELAGDCWKIRGDAANIDQVIMNLAVNARDAMEEGGGTLIIRTENRVIDDQYVSHNPEASPGRFVCLSVSDTGVGMSREVRERIFEPFFSTKEMGKGTGLGLAVVYGIVKSHSGWINVYSEQGKGTTFRVYFPALTEEASATAKAGAEESPLPQGKGERLLVVEDDEAIRKLAVTALSLNGYEVRQAASAEDALAGGTADLDLVISDVVLPRMDGLTLVEELRKRRPGLVAILCSGYADQQRFWPVIRDRGYPYLEKPFTIRELLGKVREVLDGRHPS